MRKTRKCAFCGKEFTCNSGSQRYCSEQCAEAAKVQRKKKLSYREQRELEQLEKDLEILGNEKKELEAKLAGGALSYDELQAASARFGELSAILDEKEMRWLELQD